MVPVVEIKNRSVSISTVMEKKDYCRTAILFYVLEGNVEFAYDNRKVELNESGILVINRGTEYAFKGTDNLMMASLELMGKTFESVCDGIRHYVNCNSSEGRNEHYTQLRSVLRQMILNQLYVEEDEHKYSYLVFEYYSLYYKLLETLAACFVEGYPALQEQKICSNKNAGRREEIERYLNIHYMEPISLEEVSRELYISKGYLSKYFSQSFGITFSQYLKELRLKHAMSDVLYTDHPITQIAMDNGFSGSSFFNRTFREKFQKNPTEVRSEFLKKSRAYAADEDKEEIQMRVKKLLDKADDPVAGKEQKHRFSFSALSSYPINHCWNSLINIGSASEVLRSDMQSHIMILSKYVRYARFWDPFSEEMLLDVNSDSGNYNFLRLDQVLDSLISNGMKPFIVFEPKLERVNEGIDSVIIKAVHETDIDDIRSWKNIVTAFIRHIIQKYGIDEIEQWKFELTYGVYQLKGMDPVESYLMLFKVLEDAVHEYTYQLMLGGPTLPSGEIDVFKQVLTGLKEQESMPDYISMMSFAYESNEQAHKYSIRSIDEDYLVKDVEKYRRAMEECGFREIPLYITEWNETVADRNFVNDSCYRGAYIVKSLLEIHPYVSVIGYFSGTDLRSEYYDSGLLLQGGNGMISRDGIFKPSGFALELMNMLADYQIAAEKRFMVTTDRRNNYYIIAHNKRKLSYYFYKTPEDKIEKEKLSRYCEDEECLELAVCLTDVKNGEYRIRIHKVNSRYGSILNLWKELDYSENLSRKDIMYLQRICEPHLLFYTEHVTDNQLALKVVLEANEFMLIEAKRNI